jgi:hypothetical protein
MDSVADGTGDSSYAWYRVSINALPVEEGRQNQ